MWVWYYVHHVACSAVYEVLEKIQRSGSTSEFLRTFINYPLAAALYKKVRHSECMLYRVFSG